MHIEKLSLFNFKNYEDITLDFSEKVNCLVGVNGSGKTNILDAIYYLSLTKSAFNNIDSQNIKFGERAFHIKGLFMLEEKQYAVTCGVQEGAKKSFRIDKKEYDRITEHVGRFPVVLIAPNDVDIIREGSEVRRKFFDTIICQIDNQYLENLIKYNQLLKQRNSILKNTAYKAKVDYDLINVYDDQLISLSRSLYNVRSRFIADYIHIFAEHYRRIADDRELASIKYKSDVGDEDYEERFKNNLKRDLALERTTMGVHRDDYRLNIENRPLKKFGSQGQQKTFLVAMKMAHFDIIKDVKGYKPILLLDDIFDKLDTYRIKQLVKMIADDAFGQIFITDAREERTKSVLRELNMEASFFRIEKGKRID